MYGIGHDGGKGCASFFHTIDIKSAVAIGNERQLPLRRPSWKVIDRWVTGFVARVRSVRGDRVDFQVAVAVAGKSEAGAVGGPSGIVVHATAFSQASQTTAIDIDRGQLQITPAVRGEGNSLSVRGPGGVGVDGWIV